MAARSSIVLLVVLMASSALSIRVKRDKGGQHQQVGRSLARQGYPFDTVNAPGAPRALKRQQQPYQPQFYHPTRRPPQHKRMTPARRPNDNYLISHAQQYAAQAPRPAYLPVPLPIQLHPASIVLPSPPSNGYQSGGYLAAAASAQAPYLGRYPQPQYQQAPALQQFQQGPPPAPFQPQPQYQSPPQPQYQPLPPPQPEYQPPAPQYQTAPARQPEYAPAPQPEYAPAPQPEYAPAPQPEYNPPAPQQEYQTAPQPEYAPPAPQPEYQQEPAAQQEQYSAPPPQAPVASYQASPSISSVAPLLPPPIYLRGPQYQQQQQAAPEAYNQAPQQENVAHTHEQEQQDFATVGSSIQYAEQEVAAPQPEQSYEQQQQSVQEEPQQQYQEQQQGGYAPSEPVTVPPVVEGSASYNTPQASNQQDNDIQTNAIAGPSAPSNGPKKEEASQWTQGSIPWTLEKLGLNTLNDLLVLAGLDEMFDKEGPFTVFVPVDQAFEILIQRFGGMEKASEEFNKNPEVLTSLLKHHVVAGAVPSSALQNNAVLQSALSSPLRVKFYESEDSEWRPLKVITVNGARVVRPDIHASNGLIHIVDRVLFPVPQADIYNTLKNDPQQRYTTLVSAIERAGLTSVLANPTAGPYTVFAPTNKAFSLISRAELNSILNDPARLTKLLQRHVIQDLIYTSGLQGFQKAYALDFEILYIYHAKGMTKVNGANVIDQDMTALNGVIHTIDSVLGLN